MSLRPPFSYYGGKATLAPRIAAMLPAHSHYIEPFAGGLSVLLAKPKSPRETVNDIDGDLMHFWSILRDRPDDLARACLLTPHSRAERSAALDRPDDLDPLERARRVWVCLAQGRTGTLAATGWRFEANADSRMPMPTRLSKYAARMEDVARRLRSVSLESRPAVEVIAAYGRDRRALLYVDPPYLATTRTSQNYRREAGGVTAHRELAEALRAVSATVVLSGYASPLYDELYADWYRVELESGTSQGGVHRLRTEVIWSNRPLDSVTEEPVCNETLHRCAACAGVIRRAPRGRPARYCSGACRVRAHRARAGAV